MEIKIKKAKLSKGGCVEAAYNDNDGNEITLKGCKKCHNDLRVALAKLVPYFADLTEQREADKIDWDNLDETETIELLRKIEVTGVSMGGDESNPIITLTGRRTLQTSRVLNLNTPGIEMGSEIFEWEHIDEFDLDVKAFFYEVQQYIVAKKWDVIQTELNFDESEDPFGEPTPTEDVKSEAQPVEDVA